MVTTLIDIFSIPTVGHPLIDMLPSSDIKSLALTSKSCRALVHNRSIRQLCICRKLKEPCDFFEVLEFLREDPGQRLDLCLISLASQICLIMEKLVYGPGTETESSENEDRLDQLMEVLKIQPPLAKSERTRLNEFRLDPKLLQVIFSRMTSFFFNNPDRKHVRYQLVDMEKNSPSRGPARNLIRFVLIVLARLELQEFVKDWPETHPQPDDENSRKFLEQIRYSTLPDSRHLPMQAVNEGYVSMRLVIRHLVYHQREGSRLFDRLDFRQGQQKFVQDVKHVFQAMNLAMSSVYGFNEPSSKRGIRLFNEPSFRSATRDFIRAYGIPVTSETTDPLFEEWETYYPVLIFRRFLLHIQEVRRSRWWKLKDSECEEFDRHTRNVLRCLPILNKWREWKIEREVFFENLKNGGPFDVDRCFEYLWKDVMLG